MPRVTALTSHKGEACMRGRNPQRLQVRAIGCQFHGNQTRTTDDRQRMRFLGLWPRNDALE
jgi:hypothetical protein